MDSAFSMTDDGANDCSFESYISSQLSDDTSVVADCAECEAYTDSVSLDFSPTPAPTASGGGGNNNNTASTGEIVGATVGAVVGFVLILFMGYYYLKTRKDRNYNIEEGVFGPMHTMSEDEEQVIYDRNTVQVQCFPDHSIPL